MMSLKTKRWLFWAGAVLLLSAVILLLVPTTRVIVVGYLRGEPFCQGRPVSYWISRLGSGQPYERQKAAEVLGEMGPSAAPAVRALVAALADEDKDVRRHCAGALARIGLAAGDAAEALVAAAPSLVDDPDAGEVLELDDRFEDFRTYADIPAALGPRAVPALIEGLRHEHPGVRLSAAAALARLGPSAKEAIPALIEALEDPVLRKKMRDQYPDEALPHPALRQTVRERYPDLALPDDPRLLEHSFRQMAVALGQMGPDAREAVPVILRAIKDGISMDCTGHLWNDWEGETLRALGKVDPALRDVADSLASARGAWGDRAAFLRVLDGLRSPHGRARELAAFALSLPYSGPGERRYPDETIAKALTRALADDAVEVRWSAAAALCHERFKPPQRETLYRLALPSLIESLTTDKDHLLVRALAADALYRIAASHEAHAEVQQAVPALLAALDDPVQEVRWRAGKALQELDAVPLGYLQAKTDSELDAQVRRAVTILHPERELRDRVSAQPPPRHPQRGTDGETAKAGEFWPGHVGYLPDAGHRPSPAGKDEPYWVDNPGYSIGYSHLGLPRLSVQEPLPVHVAFRDRWNVAEEKQSPGSRAVARTSIRPRGWVVPKGTTGQWTLIPSYDLLSDLAKPVSEPGEHRFAVRITLEPSLDAALYSGLPAYWPGTIELPETTVWVTVRRAAAKQK
jgi:HEAT repeat protein